MVVRVIEDGYVLLDVVGMGSEWAELDSADNGNK